GDRRSPACSPDQRCGVDVDVEDVDDRATEADGVADLDHEIAPEDVHGDSIADQTTAVRDGGHRTGTGSTRQGLPHTPFPYPHSEAAVAVGCDELDVGAPREPRIGFEGPSVLR